eukprot:Ihof_evm1s489 gene=Ihof_evmTU1s489
MCGQKRNPPTSLERVVSDVYGYKRKKTKNTRALMAIQNNVKTDNQLESLSDEENIPSDTLAAFYYLKSQCPLGLFGLHKLFIAFHHQLYSIVHDKTLVDKQLAELRKNHIIRLARLGQSANEFLVFLESDFTQYISDVVRMNVRNPLVTQPIIDRYVNQVLPLVNDASITTKTLMSEMKFSDNELTILVQCGLLNTRDVNSFWLSIPGVGGFIKNFYAGRKELTSKIRRNKYKEILQQDLENTKLKTSKLPVTLHIADLIGAEIVT